MLVNEYGIRKIKFELKITMLRLRNKPEDDMTGMWGSGNITTEEPRNSAFQGTERFHALLRECLIAILLYS